MSTWTRIKSWPSVAIDVLVFPFVAPPSKDTDPHMQKMLVWYMNDSESLPAGDVDAYLQYCQEQLKTHEDSIEKLEKKADWLMALTVGAVGVAMLRLTEANKVDVEPITWATCQLMALVGMWLCLRARLPREYPTPSPPEKFQGWIVQLQKYPATFAAWKQNEEEKGHEVTAVEPNTESLVNLQVAKAYAYSSAGFAMMAQWKSRCVKHAGGYLALAVVALMLSFGIRVFGLDWF